VNPGKDPVKWREGKKICSFVRGEQYRKRKRFSCSSDKYIFVSREEKTSRERQVPWGFSRKKKSNTFSRERALFCQEESLLGEKGGEEENGNRLVHGPGK